MSVFIGYPSFMAYQMMKGKQGNKDGFPSIPGTIARYLALGLTNEQMAANLVWVDKTGNGHDLQMKNFAWGGMSGVGGYVTKKDVYEYDLDYYSYTFIETSTKVHDFYIVFELIGYDENFKDGFNLDVRSISQGLKYRKTYTKNGIYIFQYKDEEGLDDLFAIGYNGNGGARSNFTVKILPLYPGALVFDGVDDYGVCDNFPIPTKEKGYTVVALRQYLVEKSAAYLTVNGDSIPNTSFIFEGNNYRDTWNFGKVTVIQASRILATQTSKQYNGVKLNIGSNTEGSNLLQVGKWGKSYSNAAIWELVFLDHDATEEELTKIKDYFVKTYPWLFPDQAWTVVGKTNEDKDRATIANITGNGNDLVLSNFGFSGNSGYGLYNIQEFTNWNHVADRGDIIVKNGYSVTITNSKITGSSTNYNTDILSSYNNSSTTIIFKVTGLVDGQKIFLGRKSVTDAYVIDKDGIYRSDYNIPQEDGKVIVGIGTVGFTGECNITIEQIPEYEGYLVTDGVDDEIISAKLIQFADKFTIVGDWKFMEDRNDNAGLLKANQIYIYNATTGMRIYLKQGSRNYPFSCKKINALTSDGWVYDEKWDKYKVYPIGSDIDISSRLFLGFYSSNFTKIALKNLGIYNDQLLSKDDCIKAYNYLQTLKAK